MFGYKKKNNNKKNNRSNLHTTMMNFSPFMADTRYLEHLHKEMKLRNAREGMLMMRKNMIEGNKRANYQNEMDRLQGEIHRPRMAYSTREHLEERYKQLKKLMEETYDINYFLSKIIYITIWQQQH